MTFSRPKGTNDFYGEKIKEWQALEAIVHKLCASYLINEIRTPMYEYAELFSRGVGETTDIVQKEMFTFNDAGGRLYALRPEGTANAARAFIENGMSSLPVPVKMYYIYEIFRAEKPQKGRYRQHTQFGVEYFGASGAECEAEVISVAYELFKRIGIKAVTVHINSLGCKDCRDRFNRALAAFLAEKRENLCAVCKERFTKNPLRVLDCKNENCKSLLTQAPTTLSVLDDECRAHFEDVKRLLAVLDIEYVVDTGLVRGLDYYTRTVFEFVSSDLGAQSTVCGGGRYDGLVKDCGGPETPAVGFGMGLERLLIILEEQGIRLAEEDVRPVFVGYLGEEGKSRAAKLTSELRENDIPAEFDICGRSVGSQMKYANKLNARYAVIIGGDEVKNNKVKIKDMSGEGEDAEAALNEAAEILSGLYRKFSMVYTLETSVSKYIDLELMQKSLEHAQNVVAFTKSMTEEEFVSSRLHKSAVIFEIKQVCEMLKKISVGAKSKHSRIPWMFMKELAGMAALDYWVINMQKIWGISNNEIPELITELKQLISDYIREITQGS